VGTEPVQNRLTQLEFTLLLYLYENQHRVCTNDEIGGHVWGTAVVGGKPVPQFDSTQLQQLVHRLRRKIEPADSKRQFIQNVPGVGYRLVTGRSS
jgi:DNA-binding response OmpR family regulator